MRDLKSSRMHHTPLKLLMALSTVFSLVMPNSMLRVLAEDGSGTDTPAASPSPSASAFSTETDQPQVTASAAPSAGSDQDVSQNQQTDDTLQESFASAPAVSQETETPVSEFTLTYDGNGENVSGLPSSETAEANTVITVTASVPVRTDYQFDKWNTQQDGSGTSYYAGDSVTIASDLILYAQWSTADQLSLQTIQQDYDGYSFQLTGNMLKDTQIAVETADSDLATLISATLEKGNLAVLSPAYKISISSGEKEYQPADYKETLTVTISGSVKSIDGPLSWKLYRIDNDKNVSEISDAALDTDHVEFTTDIFGNFAVAAIDENSSNHTNDYRELPEDNEATSVTGDAAYKNRRLLKASTAAVTKYDPISSSVPMPVVRDQGSYGTCWAFASIGLAELSMMRKYSSSKDLSEAQLAYYTNYINNDLNNSKSGNDPLGGTSGDTSHSLASNFLNVGGNLVFSSQALLNWVGAADESDIPYDNVASEATSGLPASDQYSMDTVHIQDVYEISLSDDRNLAKSYIESNGGIGVSYAMNYSDYSYKNNAYYNPTGSGGGHAVTIVGWDDSFSASKFNAVSGSTPSSDGAWLVRNSWGYDGYGLYGYFWMSYDDVSLNDTAYVFVAEDGYNYDHNYQYDGSNYFGYPVETDSSNSMTAANIFVAKGNITGGENLQAVSFETSSGTVNANYSVSIYKNLKDTANPESGTLVSTTSGVTAAAGSYTVPLTTDVLLNEGDTFSVVITLFKNSGYVEFAQEEPVTISGWIEIQCKASAGQSFLKSNSFWQDYGAANNANIRIKAFTSDITIPLEAISVSPSSMHLSVGSNSSLSVGYIPSDTTDDKTVTWSSSDSSVATVANGYVTGVKQGTAVITATVGSYTAKCSVNVTYGGVEGFVYRLYQICLDRTPDSTGFNSWINLLKSRRITGGEAGYGFIFSPEFKSKNLCNEHYVTYLYHAFFNREPDSVGYQGWIGALEKGETREQVYNGFAKSVEFQNLCNEYGITRGNGIDATGKNTVQTGYCSIDQVIDSNVTMFVQRLYRVCLNREPDGIGLADWTNQLTSGKSTGSDVAYGFVFSPEFMGKNYDNGTFVKYMYNAFFDRGADSIGYNTWTQLLNRGGSRLDVFHGFTGSQEFIKLCEKYHISR